MNTPHPHYQDTLTLRRLTVWTELFRSRSSNEGRELSAEEEKLYTALTCQLYADLVPTQQSVTQFPPSEELPHYSQHPGAPVTVDSALAYVMTELGPADAAFIRTINAAGSPISIMPIARVESVIRTALKSVCQPPQP